MNTISDAQLWELFIRKDKTAFEQLYRRYYSQLLSYALSFQFDEELAKDCIQDLFVKLFQKEDLRPIIHVKSYLYKIYKNLLLDALRIEPEKTDLQDDTQLGEFSIEDRELQQLFRHDDREILLSKQLIHAFNRLSANQRNALYLYYIKEFTWEELSETLDISSHSAMNLIGRATAKLRVLLAENTGGIVTKK